MANPFIPTPIRSLRSIHGSWPEKICVKNVQHFFTKNNTGKVQIYKKKLTRLPFKMDNKATQLAYQKFKKIHKREGKRQHVIPSFIRHDCMHA